MLELACHICANCLPLSCIYSCVVLVVCLAGPASVAVPRSADSKSSALNLLCHTHLASCMYFFCCDTWFKHPTGGMNVEGGSPFTFLKPFFGIQILFTSLGGGPTSMSQKILVWLYSHVSSNLVVINLKKGEILRTIKPIVGFGVDDHRIREVMIFVEMTSSGSRKWGWCTGWKVPNYKRTLCWIQRSLNSFLVWIWV